MCESSLSSLTRPFHSAFRQSPTQDERDALKSYMHLFARLYPCGECAQEFQTLLKEYPPQVS
jgi:FAD-linked sulfhydryl oxidase